MAVRTADAVWNGDLPTGSGTMTLGSGAFQGAYSFKSRMEDGPGTNPEELIGAAHAGCFSMALAAGLSAAGYVPRSIYTSAQVFFGPADGGFAISKVALTTEGDVPHITPEEFAKQAVTAKQHCPVSKALAGVEITLDATLKS